MASKCGLLCGNSRRCLRGRSSGQLWRICNHRGRWIRLANSVNHRNGRNESVSLSRDSLNKAWIVGVIVNRSPQPFKDDVQTAIEINIRPFRPQILPQLLACYKFSGTSKEQEEKTERLFLNFDTCAIACKSSLSRVCFKHAKTKEAAGLGCSLHDSAPMWLESYHRANSVSANVLAHSIEMTSQVRDVSSLFPLTILPD